MCGVSPAYFLSRYGERFTAADVAGGLKELARLGFGGFQLEVFHPDSLDSWRSGGAAAVRAGARSLGLTAHQFVAHFLLADFANPEALSSRRGVEEMKAVLEIVTVFEECRVVTVPLPAFDGMRAAGRDDYLRWFERCAGKVSRLLALVEDAGRRLALEILPGAIVGGTDGFLRLCEYIDSDTLSFNFDTGHAWACKEDIQMVPAKLGARIVGTHLCDNFGHENLSLRPGAGSIDWPRLIAGLKACGYAGPWDLEIVCAASAVAAEYATGMKFIHPLL